MVGGFRKSVFALTALAAAGSLGSCSSGTTEVAAGPQYRWLDQGWSEQQRNLYHHQSQGTLTLPIPATWFLALERPDGQGLFRDSAYLDTFGFIPGTPDAGSNPDGLPIGFARTRAIDPRSGRPLDRLGFTCAACHTGRIEYNGTTVVIDGGPAMTDLGAFRDALGEAIKRTLRPSVFHGFADRIVGPPTSRERIHERAELARALARAVVAGLIAQIINKPGGQTVEEGFGRLDALNRIGNQVFGVGMNLPRNNAALTAPVAYPHIWDAPWFDWVQYNASIMQPMVRNAGEAMGVLAVVNYREGPATPRFTSTIPVDRLHDNIEEELAGDTQPFEGQRFTGLRSPAWPEDLFGRINPELAARGATLYRERCQGCHLPAPNTPEFWAPNLWTAPDADLVNNPVRWRYLRLRQIPVNAVGTDPAQAVDMANRRVWVPAQLNLPRAVSDDSAGNLRRYRFGPALGDVVELVVNRWYDSHNTPPAERLRLNGYRPNLVQDLLVYKARPLNGVWATGPFLHNGSVPTLWALLSPYSVRNQHCNRPANDPMRCILLYGGRQFDPADVGYSNGGRFRLDTRIRGNWNTGHLFDTAGPGRIGPLLSEADRRALIEYLKTL